MAKIIVQNTGVTVLQINETDYISLTDIAKFKSSEPAEVIANWMRNRNTIEYLGIWETLYNSGFKPLEFEGFRKEAGLKGNIRDYAGVTELICLSNMENLNAVFIAEKMPQSERLLKLNRIAVQQMKLLSDTAHRKLLKGDNE